MKFVALISGGKDSFYNIHHCLSNGHELACLANLYPADKSKDEIDSFMFQTVGHDIIETYSECLDIPLYRQPISLGGSKNQNLEYSITLDDEIEDLYILLRRVKELHPDIEGVSCGAILSHYQRTRVESVCGRLGLTSLAYLWQRNQLELMGEMCSNSLDARLIKVAAIGLTSRDLGKSISEMYPKLIKLNAMYDVHICGEGGEFETLVFDAPFFKKRLEIVESQVVEESTDDVSYLKVGVKVVDKEMEKYSLLEKPPLLEEQFIDILEEVEAEKEETEDVVERLSSVSISEACVSSSTYKTPSGKIYVSNLVGTGETTEEQASSIFQELNSILGANGVSADNIKHVTLLLSDMNEFSKINSIYSKFFESYFLPPSRICVGTNLPGDQLVQLSCEVLPPSKKEGIHIRSRSYWAPHNIGPYSQSIIERNPGYLSASLSGQIPLDPSSMDFPENNDIRFHSVFSIQHLHRVTQVVNVPEYGSIVCFITDPSGSLVASSTWNEYTGGKGCLVIVQVAQLPRGAKIEWGGFSYKEITDMYQDDEEEEVGADDDKFVSEIINASGLETPAIEQIGGCDLITSTLFSNDAASVQKFLTEAAGKVQLFTSLSNSNGLKLEGIEYTPVERVWDHDGKQYSFGLVWKYYKKNP